MPRTRVEDSHIVISLFNHTTPPSPTFASSAPAPVRTLKAIKAEIDTALDNQQQKLVVLKLKSFNGSTIYISYYNNKFQMIYSAISTILANLQNDTFVDFLTIPEIFNHSDSKVFNYSVENVRSTVKQLMITLGYSSRTLGLSICN